MEMTIGSRFKHAWNAFVNNRSPTTYVRELGSSYSRRPDRPRFSGGNERSIVTPVYNRIALDGASLDIQHVRLDENGRFKSVMKSALNDCLTLEANIDQTARAFMQDVIMSMIDEGCVAIVPVDTDTKPNDEGSYDILSMRVGKILEWFPAHVKVRVYNDRTGNKEDLLLSKRSIGIVENPHYAVMNERNSIMQRLLRKLVLLDSIDEQSGSGKLDLIIQLPYIIKTDAKRNQAEERRKLIEQQLAGSKYGIAYTDATERITQLNRPVENNLMKQIEYLTNMMYSQLGITQAIMDGTADEKTMLNYYNRTIEPIVSAIVDEMKRKFLTKTARTQLQSIVFFRNPFKLVPINDIAEIADKFTRNEIMTSNEFRQVIGMKPSDDPKADQLINSNIAQPTVPTTGALPSATSESLPAEAPGADAVKGVKEMLFGGGSQNGS
ncbi:phage portal protein [Fibrobacter sp.]|uniref:phage portal protein n=1 Tax=Fibrobacter sp. TaxID=35828 RepID=UPI00388DAE47